ncbi:TetR/AcrR family transcriptional regulator [Micromonospora chersina]|uniref:Transcriptional regulator, TetR family n=1 Tax=Micromonospora chersina TaxID=47854 RepID=A0A1C6W078_9ACTN|nr:TetR/AcrR family transcriptional regulator [Micromonospora chersina]SCL71983.1 transcriptional regulator, TetR family [Micromonospora chersina]
MAENLLAPAPAERADAAANRRRILAAAERLFAERGPQISMTELAGAAGVGRATLYRRYPDVTSVAVALLDVHEQDLQQRMISGPPPLGPGASPRRRLQAFYASMVDLLEQHLPLALGAEQGATRFATGAYGFWRTFVSSLIRAAGREDDALADALLAPLAPELYRYQRHERGQTVDQVKSALAHLAQVLPD